MEEPSVGAEPDGLRERHEAHGAVFERLGDRSVVAHYGRPERTHRAVRNGVGVTESPVDVIVLTGADRVPYLNNVVTNRVPTEEGRGTYALLLDPQGRIEADLYVYHGGERLLVLAPPGRGEPIVDGWETFIQDVEIAVETDAFCVLGVHGPTATEKVASVLAGPGTPETPLSFVRGAMGEVGVTVVRSDAPTGEVGYEVVCGAASGPEVLDTLLNRGPAAVPFGRETWRALTLEAGTPLFETELADRIPNVAGVRNAVDYAKGCFVGQEVVSKVQNRGQPSRRLVGLVLEGPAEPGASVLADGDAVGEVTRSAESPQLAAPIAFAAVAYDLDEGAELAVDAEGGPVTARVEPFPLVAGSEASARIPRYD